MPLGSASLMAEVTHSSYGAHFPNPPFNLSFAELDAAAGRVLAAPTLMVPRRPRGAKGKNSSSEPHDFDIRCLIHELAALNDHTVLLTVATGNQGSVKPTEVLQAALALEAGVVPLIKVHKFGAMLVNGESPLAGAVARAEVTPLEARDSDFWEPARDARGDPGG